MLFFPLEARCVTGANHTTDDVNLLNAYFYRLVERASVIDPGKRFTNTFRPISEREAGSLFHGRESIDFIYKKIVAYLAENKNNLEFHNLTLSPLNEIHVTGICSDQKNAPLYQNSGAEMDGYCYGSIIGGGNAIWKDYALIGYDLRLSNDGDVHPVDFYRYKLKAGFEHTTLSIARDTIVVGPGSFGQLLMSANVQPENSVIIKTEVPYNLWLLGAFRFYLWHVWYDDDERANKDPRLWGARISLMPWDTVEIGLSRTAMYGGSQNSDYDSIEGYWEMFTARNENDGENEYDSEQIAGIDLSVVLPFAARYTPFSGAKAYYEYTFTDIRACWQPEDRDDGNLLKPLAGSHLIGLFLTTGSMDIRLEYMNTHKLAYKGGDSQGYSDNGYLIGHYSGLNTKGLTGEIYYELIPMLNLYTGAGYMIHKDAADEEQIEKNIFAGADILLTESILLTPTFQYSTFDKTDRDPSPIRYDFANEEYDALAVSFRMNFIF